MDLEQVQILEQFGVPALVVALGVIVANYLRSRADTHAEDAAWQADRNRKEIKEDKRRINELENRVAELEKFLSSCEEDKRALKVDIAKMEGDLTLKNAQIRLYESLLTKNNIEWQDITI